MPEDRFNPYVPPASKLAPPRLDGGLSIRAAMLKHEVSIHGVAIALFTLGVLLICASIVAAHHRVVTAEIALGAVALGALDFYLDYGLRRYWSSAQIIAVATSSLIALVFPVYLLVALYVTPTLVNQQARQIFSNDYRAVIAATPHLSVPVSRATRIFILVLGIAITVIAFMLPSGR